MGSFVNGQRVKTSIPSKQVAFSLSVTNEESRDKLQAVNMEMAKSQEQLSSENAHLKGEIESLKLLVKAAEDSLEAEKAEFKKTVEETNIKVNGFLSTRNNLHFALRNHLTSWLTK